MSEDRELATVIERGLAHVASEIRVLSIAVRTLEATMRDIARRQEDTRRGA